MLRLRRDGRTGQPFQDLNRDLCPKKPVKKTCLFVYIFSHFSCSGNKDINLPFICRFGSLSVLVLFTGLTGRTIIVFRDFPADVGRLWYGGESRPKGRTPCPLGVSHSCYSDPIYSEKPLFPIVRVVCKVPKTRGFPILSYIPPG